MYTYLCWMVLAIYIQTGIQVNANRVPPWAQLGVKLDQMWIHLNWSGPPWIQPNPFAGLQTTTININTNNRFLLPRGGLTVYIYIYIYKDPTPILATHTVVVNGRYSIVDSGCKDVRDEISVFISTKLKNNIKPTKLYAWYPTCSTLSRTNAFLPKSPANAQRGRSRVLLFLLKTPT